MVLNMKTNHSMVVILGPTASGKTQLAVQLANILDGEIISADSRQVYRGMDIGTGKDLNEYNIDNQSIPYHLIDIIEAGETYNLYRFQQDFHVALADILSRNKISILCGGSGLYLEAVLKGHQFTAIPTDIERREALELLSYDELIDYYKSFQTDFQKVAEVSTRKRLIRAIEISEFLFQNQDFKLESYPTLPPHQVFGLNPPLDIRRERISKRLKQRLENGLIEEVKTLLTNEIPPEKLVSYGLEYKFITEYLTGKYDFKTLFSSLEIAIHQFAKRQMTYFRKMENDNIPIQWLPENDKIEFILSKMAIL